MNRLHIGGNEGGIHRIAIPIAKGIAVILADGLLLFAQIHLNDRLFDLIGHGGRAGHRYAGVVQHPVFPVGHKAVGTGAHPEDLHRHFLGAAGLHIDIDIGRVAAFRAQGIGSHIPGIHRRTYQSFLFLGFGDIRQIDLKAGVAAVDLGQLTAGTVEGQVHGICGNGGDHQVPLVERRFSLHYHGNIVDGVGGLLGDVAHNIQPQAEGNDY